MSTVSTYSLTTRVIIYRKIYYVYHVSNRNVGRELANETKEKLIRGYVKHFCEYNDCTIRPIRPQPTPSRANRAAVVYDIFIVYLRHISSILRGGEWGRGRKGVLLAASRLQIIIQLLDLRCALICAS